MGGDVLPPLRSAKYLPPRCPNSRAKARRARPPSAGSRLRPGSAALATRRLSRAPRQRQLLQRLVRPQAYPVTRWREDFEDWRTPMRALVARGFVSSAEIAEDSPAGTDRPTWCAPRAPRSSRNRRSRSPPSTQRSAIRAIPAVRHHRQRQDRGLSARGGAALRRGRRALVLVPEIGLTPQLVGAIPRTLRGAGRRAAFGAHRYRAARRLAPVRVGQARIVLGTRSAVFAPVAGSRHRDRRRGTRRVVQAARKRLPLLGARPRDPARAARAGAHRAGFRDALARDPAERRRPAIHATVAAAARGPGAAAARGRHRSARACGAPGHFHAGGRSHAATPGRRRPGAGVHQPPRLFAHARLHAPAAGSRPAATATRGSPCTSAARGCAAITAARTRRCRSIVRSAATTCATWARAPSASRRRWRSCSRTCPSRGSIATWCASAATSRQVVSRIASGEARILVGTQMVTKGHDFPERHAGRGAERRPGPVQHGFSRAGARGADHHPGRGPRRTRQQTRRSADPDGVSRASAAQEPAQRRLRRFRAHGARRARGRAAGRRSRTSPRCALRRRTLAGGRAISCARRAQLARRAARREVVRPGAGGDGQARRALSRAVADRGARARAAASRCWPSGCRRSKNSRRRATCAGRSTSIRSSCSDRCALASAARWRAAPRSPRRRIERLAARCAPRSPAAPRAASRSPPAAGRRRESRPAAVTGIRHSAPCAAGEARGARSRAA